eukprot:jgi/Mesvir1/26486/Mv16155-RA.1
MGSTGRVTAGAARHSCDDDPCAHHAHVSIVDDADPAPPAVIHDKHHGAAVSLMSGLMAGIASRTVVAPLERLKLELLLNPVTLPSSSPVVASRSSSLGSSVLTSFPRLTTLVRDLVEAEGIGGLWKGLGLTIMRTAPFKAVNFYAFDTVHMLLNKAALAQAQLELEGGGREVRVNPLSLLPFNNKRKASSSRSSSAARRGASSQDGADAGNLGALATSLSDKETDHSSGAGGKVIGAATGNQQPLAALSVEQRAVNQFLAGAVAGMVASLLCFPLDTIRTRMMAKGGAALYRNPVHCAARMVAEEGVGSLYRGVLPSVVAMMPSGAIFYGVYGVLKDAQLRRQHADMVAKQQRGREGAAARNAIGAADPPAALGNSSAQPSTAALGSSAATSSSGDDRSGDAERSKNGLSFWEDEDDVFGVEVPFPNEASPRMEARLGDATATREGPRGRKQRGRHRGEGARVPLLAYTGGGRPEGLSVYRAREDADGGAHGAMQDELRRSRADLLDALEGAEGSERAGEGVAMETGAARTKAREGAARSRGSCSVSFSMEASAESGTSPPSASASASELPSALSNQDDRPGNAPGSGNVSSGKSSGDVSGNASGAGSAPHPQLSVAHTLLFGATAGASAEFVCYPMEVVRREMQLQGYSRAGLEMGQHATARMARAAATKFTGAAAAVGHGEAGAMAVKHLSAVGVARELVIRGGVPALYAGVLPSLLQVLPSAAVSYFVYETMKKVLSEQAGKGGPGAGEQGGKPAGGKEGMEGGNS